MIQQTDHIHLKPGSLFLLAFCAAILLWTAAEPFSRAFRLTEIIYNEGWNVYNTQKVAWHQPLYAVAYGWTTPEYPALSFHLVAALGKSTSDYLFTGRMLSLAGLCLSGVMAGLIVSHTTHSKIAAWFTGLYLVAFFCAFGNKYVGLDDPQMLAHPFYLAGLYVYLKGNRRGWALDLTALLFVLTGNIKHNLIEFPIAVLLDLLFSSPRRALRYSAVGAAMAAVSVVLTRHIDGAAYVACLLAPRSYSVLTGIQLMFSLLIMAILPVVAALFMAFLCWKNPSQRVLALTLFCALAANTYFSGGSGGSINRLFGSILAIVLLNGVFWAEFSKLPLGRICALSQVAVCSVFFLWLAIPMFMLGNWRTDEAMQQDRDAERRFAVEVAFLRQQPGAALCESLLRCAFAGKPYIYDPYNATRFIEQGRLDPNVIVNHLKNHEYGTVQLNDSLERKLADPRTRDRFVLPILQAIGEYYRPGMENEDGVIFLPKDTVR